MRYICKFHDQGQDWYLEWESEYGAEFDGPATPGMSLDDFKVYYSNRYGPHRLLLDFPEQLRRVEERDISTRSHTLDELIAWNRAGKDGTRLTREQIIDWYIRHRDECRNGYPCPLEGAPVTA